MATGTVIWFNKVKGHGFISTHQGERLYVDAEGLDPAVNPLVLRNGVEVEFSVRERESGREAASLALKADVSPRRARRRHGH
jgi:cold shock CspA family protein